jgi:hypothetical protein
MLLKVGSRGEEVKQLQAKLGLSADGVFGPGTEKEVKKWQLFLIGNGYKKVMLCDKLTKKAYLIHRIVALTYLDNIDNKPCVNHKNGIKSDNRLENLEWCNYS